MADLQGLVSFPSINQIIAFDYTLAHGITPSVATLTVAPQAGFAALDGDLVLTFGSTQVVLPNCRINRHSFQFNEQGLIWRLSLYDKRWRWKFGRVTGSFNLRKHKLGDFDDTLDRSTEMRPTALAKMCLYEMYEDLYDLSRMPDTARPEIHWDNVNPAQALADLVEHLGCRIVLKTGGLVSVEPVGLGAPLPDGAIIQRSLSIDPPTLPDAIVAVGGPTRYQVDVLLEPCGLDVDGNVKAINDLSYKPAGGWGSKGGAMPNHFQSVEDGVARQLAKETVFRWFRIAPQPLGIDGQPLKIPGYDDPIRVAEQILPIESVQVETFVDQALVMQVQDKNNAVPVTQRTPRSKPALVWGWHNPDDLSFVPKPPLSLTQDINNSLLPPSNTAHPIQGTNAKKSILPDGYSIDTHHGIVKFRNYKAMFILTAADLAVINGGSEMGLYTRQKLGGNNLTSPYLIPAVLGLRCACSIRDPAAKVPDRYERLINLAGQKPPGRTTGPRVLRHDEIVLNIWGQRPGIDNALQGVRDTKKQGMMPDSPGVDEQLDYYVQAALAEYQTPSPEEAQYAGIMAVDPDGAIQTVSWTISQAGAFTHVTRNSEMMAVPVPYRERRFFEKFWGGEWDRIRDQARRDFQQREEG